MILKLSLKRLKLCSNIKLIMEGINMELDLKNYKKDIYYNKSISSEIEKKIYEIMEKTKNTNYDDTFTSDTDNIIFNQLSNVRRNIIDWYDFKENSNILEIGTGYGIITEMLCKKANRVVSVDFVKKRAQIVSDKLSRFDNLKLKVGHLKDIKIDMKFDYIILIGSIEAYKMIYGDSILEFFKYLKGLLNDNGIILIAVDNIYGIKKFAGSLTEYDNTTFNVFEENSELTFFSKFMLEDVIKKSEFKNYNFYYPLPDYRLTESIFSDKYLPISQVGKIMYHPNNLEGSNIIFNELLAVKNIVKNNKFDVFANSFFVEIFKSDEKIKSELVKFVSFNNMRKEKYRLITKMYDKFVLKIPQFCDAKLHLKKINENIELLKKSNLNILDTFNDGKIVSKFCKYSTLDKVIIDKIFDIASHTSSEEIIFNIFMDYVINWINFIKSNFSKNTDVLDIKQSNIFKYFNIEVEDEKIKDMYFIKEGFIDIVFENIFFYDNKYFLYDQEWEYENVPLEYIIFRAIHNIYLYFSKLENFVSQKKVLEYLKILPYYEIFEKVESKFQDEIIDSKRKHICTRNYNFSIDEVKKQMLFSNKYINELKKDLDDYKLIKQDYLKTREILNSKDEEIKRLNNKLSIIYNSRLWKISTKLKLNKRLIKGINNGEN